MGRHGWVHLDRVRALRGVAARVQRGGGSLTGSMPQLKEDEWPKDDQPTTTEQEQQLKHDEKRPTNRDGAAEYPPKLPPDALPTKD